MDLNLNGKKALVTGASKGIGLGIAKRLVLEGCHVLLVARNEDDLKNAQNNLSELNQNVTVDFKAMDLSITAEVESLARENIDLDILVNNAGAIPAGNIDRVDEDTWRAAWDLKLFGYISLCRGIYANMSKRQEESGQRVILNIIGAGGERPSSGYIAGAGANAGLMAITRAMGGVSRKHGIRVLGINPGQIVTERLETMQRVLATEKFGDSERWKEMWDTRYPPGNVEHIADASAFLVSDLSSNTTGTIVTIDGGHCAR
ncbi:short-chain dehydrogenase/reductase [Gammaproteobacteria bacterium]|nr:short-chain dehydrogenase/reductase [Gammaproteobacteria bacterium]